jgi:hypothetical protein
VPPSGYVALGMAATMDSHPPPSHAAFCVRSDAVKSASISPRICVQVTAFREEVFATTPAQSVSLCVYDPLTLALQLRSHNSETMPSQLLALKSYSQVQERTESAGALPFSLHVNTSSVCVRVRNLIRVPLIEVETAQVIMEYEMKANGCVHALLTCSPEIWSYNAPIKEWEQVLERVPVQVGAPSSFP